MQTKHYNLKSSSQKQCYQKKDAQFDRLYTANWLMPSKSSHLSLLSFTDISKSIKLYVTGLFSTPLDLKYLSLKYNGKKLRKLFHATSEILVCRKIYKFPFISIEHYLKIVSRTAM